MTHRPSLPITLSAILRAAALALPLCTALLTGTAQAAMPEVPPVEVGGVFVPGHTLAGPVGQASFDFSDDFIGGLQIMAAVTMAVGPARFSYGDEYMFVQTPLWRMDGHAQGDSLHMDGIETRGGVQFVTTPRAMPGPPGRMALTDWRIDLARKAIYVDVDGANGVGIRQSVHMWDFAGIEGSGQLAVLACPPDQANCIPNAGPQQTRLTGLTITTQGLDLFNASMALRPGGIRVLQSIPDFGTLTLSAVPEPANALLMLPGLAGLAWVARSKKAVAGVVHLQRRSTDFRVLNQPENRSHC